MRSANRNRNNRDNGNNNVGFRLASTPRRMLRYSLPELLRWCFAVTQQVCTGVSMVRHPVLDIGCTRQRGRQGSSSAERLHRFGQWPVLIFTVMLIFAVLAVSSASAQQPASDRQLFDQSVPEEIAGSADRGEVSAEEICRYEPGTGPEMVVLPPGQFEMGSDATDAQSDERPVHTVTIDYPFALSRCEISVAEFAAFIDDSGYLTSAEEGGGCWVYDPADSGFIQKTTASWRSPGFAQQVDHPAVCISWDDAVAYIEWLNGKTGSSFRLPSEAELEYAIRGGAQEDYPWGQASQCGYSNASDQSMPPELQQLFESRNWSLADCDDGYGYTAPVASYPVNPFGLYDVSGNAWEWTQDCWNENYENAPRDGSAWETGECGQRVLRGGGWYNGPVNLRSADRDRNFRGSGFSLMGFRLARTL